jgi:hypothetical protein
MRKLFLLALLVSLGGYAIAGTTFSGRTSAIKVGNSTTFTLNTDLDIDEGTFRVDTGGTLDAAAGKRMVFDQGIFEHHDFETYMTGDLDMNSASHDVRLNTNGDVLRVEPGTIIDGIAIDQHVTATVLGQPFLDDTILVGNDSGLWIGIQSRLNKNITTSASDAEWVAGTVDSWVMLLDDLKLEDDIKLDHVGTISFNGKTLHTGAKSLTWSGSNQVWYQAADLTLGGDLTLNSTIVFDGASTATSYVIGNNHTINMNDNCIFVAEGHTLRLENLTIMDLKGSSSAGSETAWSTAGAICMESNAVLEIKNVTIILASGSDYYFARGTIDVLEGGFLKILPGATAGEFIYDTSARHLNIKSNAKLGIGRDALFRYHSTTATEIEFEDSTSELEIVGGQLNAYRDWTMAKGTLLVDGKSTFQVVDLQAVTMDATNKPDIVVMPGATFSVTTTGYKSDGTTRTTGDFVYNE